MQKLLSLLALILTLPLWAQETATHANRLYFTMGESNDRSQVPLTLYLESPTIALTAVEVYITLPDGATLDTGTLSDRAAAHSLIEGDVNTARFVSIASPELAVFGSSDAPLCTWTCNLSSLANGTHTITATGMFAVGVNNEEVTSYAVADQSIEVKIDGTTTEVFKVKTENGELKTVYDLQGRKVKTENGELKGIYIINGKKVKL